METKHLGAIVACGSKGARCNSFSYMSENYYRDVEIGLQKEMIKNGYGLMTMRIDFMVKNIAMPPMLKNDMVDGVFVIGGMFNDSLIKMLRKKKIPIVVLGRDYEDLDCVNTDYTEATYSGVKYLLEKGHRDILYISGPDRTPTSRLKDIGYKKALEEYFMQASERRYIKSEFSGDGGYWAVKTVFEKKNLRPTAIFASSDGIAAGVLGYLYEQRLRVPDDISVVAYERSVLTEYLTPVLTSIDVHKNIIGSKAAHMMIQRLQNPDLPRQYCEVPTELVEGASVREVTI